MKTVQISLNSIGTVKSFVNAISQFSGRCLGKIGLHSR